MDEKPVPFDVDAFVVRRNKLDADFRDRSRTQALLSHVIFATLFVAKIIEGRAFTWRDSIFVTVTPILMSRLMMRFMPRVRKNTERLKLEQSTLGVSLMKYLGASKVSNVRKAKMPFRCIKLFLNDGSLWLFFGARPLHGIALGVWSSGQTHVFKNSDEFKSWLLTAQKSS
jgi:hypothetical protein